MKKLIASMLMLAALAGCAVIVYPDMTKPLATQSPASWMLKNLISRQYHHAEYSPRESQISYSVIIGMSEVVCVKSVSYFGKDKSRVEAVSTYSLENYAGLPRLSGGIPRFCNEPALKWEPFPEIGDFYVSENGKPARKRSQDQEKGAAKPRK